MKKIGRLCIITDIFVQRKYSHLDIATMAIEGGADIIQFRDKLMSTSELIETASAIKEICLKSNTTFIVNDRVDVAMIIEADGVHLGKEDVSINEARKLLGNKKIIGATAHNFKEALVGQKNGADYLGFGHIFNTYSKIKTTKPRGLRLLKKVVESINIPILAIGGINLENVKEVIDTGVHGIAVIGGVVLAENPIAVIKKLKNQIYAKN